MNRALITALLALPLTACSLFGYHKLPKAERAPPEEAARVEFPDSFEDGIHLTGPMAAALEVAMTEFLPPGSEVKTNAKNKRVAQCLSRRSTYETLILKASDTLYFVAFIPDLKRCGLEDEILDGGAVYAVDNMGRVLGVR
ncbi:hypothetical protein [Myxococcus sp. RHSTA-1-4]|uniref:hypothetical protein n=1 Tax=Myxococcus sp. RHSTA-1-4 TaxID=2874601 RepID=UPI001CC10649|nr:hypothetical protein [Myxococcus sp. RHSTA-1-4]MBZ4419321.1 hypothetical protein [Myxococcus sp. RHSTA-1-4]